MKNKTFVLNSLKVLIGNVLSLVSGILVGFLIPKILGYEDFSNYKIYTLYITYLSLLTLGFGDGLYLKYSGLNPKEFNKDNIKLYVRKYYIWLFIVFVPFFLMSFVFEGDTRFICCCLSITMLITNVVSMHQNLSLIHNRFNEYTIRTIIKAVLTSLLVVSLFISSYYFHNFLDYKIYLIGTISCDFLLMVWYFLTYRDINFAKINKSNITEKKYFSILKIGLPLLLSNLAGTIYLNLDRQFVSIFFSKTDYAIYAFAYNILTLVTTATSAVSLALFPAMKSDVNFKMENKFSVFVKYMSLLVGASLFIYFPLTYFVEWFLPNYVLSIDIFKIILPGIAFSSIVTTIIINFYKTEKKVTLYLIVSLANILISIGLNFLAYYLFDSYLWISAFSVISIIVWYITLSIFFVKKYKVNFIRNFSFLIMLSAAFYADVFLIENRLIGMLIFILMFVTLFAVFYRITFLTLIKKIRRVFLHITDKIKSYFRRSRLKNKHFTIISNNCFGGTVYEFFNLVKQSPTVGLFMFPDDYLKFLKKLNYYLEQELFFVEFGDSKHSKYLSQFDYYNEHLIIGKLDDIELIFLHYKNREEAKSKWKRRCDRINKNLLIVKFNDQNGFVNENFYEFKSLPYKNKIFITSQEKFKKEKDQNLNVVVIPNSNGEYVFNDMAKDVNKHFNLLKYINGLNEREDL